MQTKYALVANSENNECSLACIKNEDVAKEKRKSTYFY